MKLQILFCNSDKNWNSLLCKSNVNQQSESQDKSETWLHSQKAGLPCQLSHAFNRTHSRDHAICDELNLHTEREKPGKVIIVPACEKEHSALSVSLFTIYKGAFTLQY
jgi:hypothetical protein